MCSNVTHQDIHGLETRGGEFGVELTIVTYKDTGRLVHSQKRKMHGSQFQKYSEIFRGANLKGIMYSCRFGVRVPRIERRRSAYRKGNKEYEDV